MPGNLKFIDIGANLLDSMYQGEYNGKAYHYPDLEAVLSRAWAAGVEKIIITAGNLQEARAALDLARTDARLFSTVGVHPTRCGEFESYSDGPEAYLSALTAILEDGMKDGKVVAVGEFGLDYDRLHFCDADTQKRWFEAQFKLAKSSGLPCFLHLRAASVDFMEIINRRSAEFTAGVVHSFDGTVEELEQVLEHDKLSIGINGCSLKTQENLDVMMKIPLERLLLETDCPWCDIRPTHAGSTYVQSKMELKDKKKHDPELGVKGRNEPCNIIQVLQVVAGARGLDADIEVLARQLYKNADAMFFTSEESDQ